MHGGDGAAFYLATYKGELIGGGIKLLYFIEFDKGQHVVARYCQKRVVVGGGADRVLGGLQSERGLGRAIQRVEVNV